MPKAYTDGQLKAAVSAVRQGRLTISKAAREYNVPKTTVGDHVQDRHADKTPGPAKTLSQAEEDGLVNFVKFMASQGFPMSRAMIRCYIQELYKRSGRSTRFNLEHGPSDRWFRKLVLRHPDLSERKAENTDRARTRMSNIKIIDEFFKFFEGVLTEHKMADKPSQIFNCDETGWSGKESHRAKVMGPKKGHIFKQKGTTSEHVTAHLCVSANGYFIPPLIIYKGGLPHRTYKDGIPGSWMFAASESGYMDTELFKLWFTKLFIPNCGKSRPVILVMDNHDSHISLPVVEAAREEGIVLVGLPSHTTHILQPLDVKIIGPLKNKFASYVSSLGVASPSAVVGKAKFPVVLHHAMDAMAPATIKEAFRMSGLYPLDQSVIDKSQLVPSLFNDEDAAEGQEPTRTCGECGQYVGQNPLVKRGLIPQSMADVFVPPPVKPLQLKKRRMVLEGRMISGDGMLEQLQEKEAANEKKKEEQETRILMKELRQIEKQKEEEEKQIKRQKREEDRKQKQEKKEKSAAEKQTLKLKKYQKRKTDMKQTAHVVNVINSAACSVSEGVSGVSEGVSVVSEGVSDVSEGVSDVSEGVIDVSEGVSGLGEGVSVVSEGVSGASGGVSSEGRLDAKKYTCGVCGERGRVSDEANGIEWFGCDDDMCVRAWYHFKCLTEPEKELLRESLNDESIYWYCRFCIPYLYED